MLGDISPETTDDVSHAAMVRVHHSVQLFRIETRRRCGCAYKHHSHLTALGATAKVGRRRRFSGRFLPWREIGRSSGRRRTRCDDLALLRRRISKGFRSFSYRSDKTESFAVHGTDKALLLAIVADRRAG